MHQNYFFFFFFFFFFFTFFLGSVLSADWQYEVCEPQNCGSGPNISFPFHITNGGTYSDGVHNSDFCGYKGFEVICNVDKPIFRTPNDDYIIQDISYASQSLKLINAEFSGTTCLAPLRNFSSDRFQTDPNKYSASANYFLYLIPNQVANLYFFYNCTTPNDTNFTLTCAGAGAANATDLHSFPVLNPDSSYVTATAQTCSSYVWQTVDWNPSDRNNYTKLVKDGLTARWSEPTGTSCPKCQRSGGRCGMKYKGVVCFCPDGDHLLHCHDNRLSKKGAIALAAIFGGILMIIILVLACYCCARNGLVKKSLVIWKETKLVVFSFLVKIKNCVCSYQSSVWKKSKETVLALVGKIKCSSCCCRFNIWKKNRDNKQVEDFMRNYKLDRPRRYSYADIKRMTASFAKKLGEGGYGDVYKGKLHDGTEVAVKVLNKSKSDGEDFINELASISRTSHVNVVDILGFCFEGSRRALIFEFMSNGSLEKYTTDSNTESKLEWKVMYQISIGIARGLEYLHRGCNARILHFDIKPPNILLDEDFCPKISDFGLAKLCPRKESLVVISKGKGTPGYVAPEVFYNDGPVSHKSDIYSYGMMVSEMVGRRKNSNANADHASQRYFPRWIYNRVEQGEELGLGDMDEEEKECARKMIMVSLWCIQMEPSDRPTIREVLGMLEGSVESLKMPPRPFLCSPPTSEANSLTFANLIS